VIATDFSHARELLGDGAGLLVPHRDPAALARALRRVLTEPELAQSMKTRSGQSTALPSWQSAAAAFRDVARSAIGRRATTMRS
jgi:glycosyltransferase involved in cell wall biosynthesis